MLFTREPVAENTLTEIVDEVFLPAVLAIGLGRGQSASSVAASRPAAAAARK